MENNYIEYNDNNIDKNKNKCINNINAINELVNDKEKLQGAGWNLYKQEINEYNDKVAIFLKKEDDLQDIIKKSINQINTIIDNYKGKKPIPKGNFNIPNEIKNSEDNIKKIKAEIINLKQVLYTCNNNDIENKDETKREDNDDNRPIYNQEIADQISNLEVKKIIYQNYINCLYELESAQKNCKKAILEKTAILDNIIQTITN